MKFTAIVGTNAQLSYNRKLLQFMRVHFKEQASIQLVEINGLPLFNENDCAAVPDDIKQVSDTIQASDGIIFATPEYNHSIPSPLKSLLDWLSCTSHPLKRKPVMIVGASLGMQGTSRAQGHLRQILDSPGIDAIVMPGDDFLLANCEQAFGQHQELKDAATVKFLEKCFSDFSQFAYQYSPRVQATLKGVKSMNITKPTVTWDAVYDTIVIGFGGAGATAARFAADAGAQVLITDAAPSGHEGGNTRYSAQLIGAFEDFDEGKRYYQHLNAPLDLDEDVVDTFVEGMVNMPEYVREYLGVTPVSLKHDFTSADTAMPVKEAVYEYPEYAGHQAYDCTAVHHGIFDAALWHNLRRQVTDRMDKIDVWLGSPAVHLIQDPVTKTIVGVQIEHQHVMVNVRARRGVVLASGGFENNPRAIQDYLGADYLAPVGTMFNKGAGLRMAQEVGADLWHMHNYESAGIFHGLVAATPRNQRGRLILNWPDAVVGSVMVVADDGSRYFKEDEANRHGHLYDHGTWRIPRSNVHPHLIFDQSQLSQIQSRENEPIPDFEQLIVKANSIADLAQIIHADPAILTQTISDFNFFAKDGRDYAHNRNVKTMRAFDQGPYYALQLTNDILNTQGGPRRSSRAEILDVNQHAIPHLFGAGELGGVCTNQYQGGENLAECLIFGKIAGENAAHADKNTTDEPLRQLASEGKHTVVPKKISTGKNQYLGVSDDGIGGQVVARITYTNGQLKNVEIVKQNETGDIGGKAVAALPQAMVAANTYDVDAISGASASSKAIKSAVKNALVKATAK
ncbi:NAD(P)H-dependent oxidoreductase [Lactiplantibacillus carotarum]|uniref:NAD(P)H-dependent oxidoreductase n=1 Tax=Lactiplantibacillus carotarum TaxID=2993456 RepID=UPI00298EF624|nr:NAD(P)H-dependent oxidoreductase [Lactiplantibacillus carotarum]